MVYRVTESKSRIQIAGRSVLVVHYCEHLANPESDPSLEECDFSMYTDVKAWHTASRDELARRPSLRVRTVMQDTEKTLEIYEDALYPFMCEHRL